MQARTIVLLLLSVASAGGTAHVTRGWLEAREAVAVTAPAPVAIPQAPRTVVEILVADTAIAAGTILNEGHLRWQAWPEDAELGDYFSSDAHSVEEVMGAVVRSGLSAGEPLTPGRVVRPGDRGFLAAMLAPGLRAASVPVNATTGISGLVFPGDRVDVLLTHTFERQDGDTGLPRRATETVLENLRVLAIDQLVDDQNGDPLLAKTVTLEVTPKQAEILAIAIELGQLSLSLRSVASGAEGEGAGSSAEQSLTLDSHVSRLLDPPTKNEGDAGGSVAVVRGGQVQNLTFGGAAQP